MKKPKKAFKIIYVMEEGILSLLQDYIGQCFTQSQMDSELIVHPSIL